MVDRTTKLRWRRRVRRSKQRAENFSEQAEQHLEDHVITRLGRLWNVRRFLTTWVLIITLMAAALIAQTRALSQYYQTPMPEPGGTYTEGIVGSFTNANPLYATGLVDSSVARLVFAGLFKYDDKNQLVGDLAQSWEVNERGNVYTVRLRPNLVWQDGKKLTSEDVVFTYQMIQNPDAKSALFNSWQGVKVVAVDENTVTFTLPQALISFPYSMTNGLVPKHLLSGIPPSQLRSVAFNTVNPVGAGPFKWEKIEVVGSNPDNREERIGLQPNDSYVGGKPKLDGFVVRAFRSQEAIVDSFNDQELNAMVGFNKVPDEAARRGNIREYSFPLTSQTMVFLRTTHDILADVRVRKALMLATDTKNIASNLGYSVKQVNAPLLRSQVGYDGNLVQLGFDPEAAGKLLDEAGWVKGSDGFRYKDGKLLTFRMISESTPEYAYVTGKLQGQWRSIGVNAQFSLEQPGDMQTALAFHNYDALLYGISVGVDPDVLAYWHSSQADIRSVNRLNFSEYNSKAADAALEAGRTRSDNTLRAIKYRPFLEAWRNDVPAIGLYQPRFLYITHQQVAGLSEHTINSATDRYSNVQNWMIKQAPQDIPQP